MKIKQEAFSFKKLTYSAIKFTKNYIYQNKASRKERWRNHMLIRV